MTLKYRCGRTGCRRIYRLVKHPDEYAHQKRCACGGALHDYSADRRRNKPRTCRCDGYPYPHKKASGVWCRHHPTGPTDQDHEDRRQ